MAQRVVTVEQKLVGAVPGQAEVVLGMRQQAEQILLVLERDVPEQAGLEQAGLEQVVLEQVVLERVVLEQAVLEQAVLERVVP